MMQVNVSDGPGSYVGPQPEGCVEGQMCVFLIRKGEAARGCAAETQMKECWRGSTTAAQAGQVYLLYCTRLLVYFIGGGSLCSI